jgi:hypothetical protein
MSPTLPNGCGSDEEWERILLRVKLAAEVRAALQYDEELEAEEEEEEDEEDDCCTYCGGSGGEEPAICRMCGGTGQG